MALPETRHPPAARRIAELPLRVASWLYGGGATLHRAVYETGWRSSQQLGCRVLSVGNLVAGGTGKTPTAAWLAHAMHRRGRRVVLASRGHRRSRRDPVTVVSDGTALCADLAHSGDEPRLLALHAPGVPVLVGRDRARVGRRAVSEFAADLLVLDDGFQHHRLARDAEILMVDGSFGFGNGHLLPRGPLRERPEVLSRVDAVVVMDGPLTEAADALLVEYAPRVQRFRARRRPLALSPVSGGVERSAGWLKGREVGMLAAIARPQAFHRTLESLGARVVIERCFRDHHRYRSSDLRALERDAAVWVTTEKDAVKIQPAWTDGLELLVLRIELEVETPERLLDWVEAKLDQG